MTHRAGHAAAVVALLGFLASCSSGGTASEATSTTTSSSPAGDATTTTAASTTTTTTVTLPTAAELQAALLSQSDLGAPYSAQQSSGASESGSSDQSVSGCPGLSRELNSGSSSQTGLVSDAADFTAGQTGPFVIEQLLTGPPAQFASDYNQSVSDLKSCRNLTLTSGGTKLDFTLTPINFVSGATAARMDATYEGVQVNGYIAVQRVGSAGLVFLFFQIGSGSSQEAYTIYTQALKKAQSHLGQPTT